MSMVIYIQNATWLSNILIRQRNISNYYIKGNLILITYINELAIIIDQVIIESVKYIIYKFNFG